MARIARSTTALACLCALTLAVSACGGGKAQPSATPASTTVAKPSATPALAQGSCWGAGNLGDDPHAILGIAKEYAVPYPATARALNTRPDFAAPISCAENHSVEAYKLISPRKLSAKVRGYAALLKPDSAAYKRLDEQMAAACQTPQQAQVAKLSGVPGATLEATLPDWMQLGWAPAPPQQWKAGKPMLACTLTLSRPSTETYAQTISKRFGTDNRTCIDNASLRYVDCATKHNRERIAVLDVRKAVSTGAFPKAIRRDSSGRVVAIPESGYAKLDRACTAYLRSISTTKKLTGVAQTDPDLWPAADGSYPVFCEAGVAPGKRPISTQGSVYNRP